MTFIKDTQHSMLRRCSNWDYCAPAIYMVTLTLEDRSEPLLGRVIPFMQSDEIVRVLFKPTELGKAVIEHWKAFSEYNPEIQPLYLQLMEEHLHGIIRVTAQMKRPLGNAIGGFKSWCNKYYRQTTGTTKSLFSSGFNDSILFGAGQLERMFRYLRDNPRRWAVRRQYPDFFTTLHEFQRAGGSFTAYGNIFLLDKPYFHLLQISRSISDADLDAARDAMHHAIAKGAVVVSACISDGERKLMREALSAGASLIALKKQGFRKMYKPGGDSFDACAEGRLLLLAPSEWDENTELTREQCYVMNALAAKIAGGLPQDIQYHGQSPADIEALLHQAGF